MKGKAKNMEQGIRIKVKEDRNEVVKSDVEWKITLTRALYSAGTILFYLSLA